MTKEKIYGQWNDIIEYGGGKPGHTVLVDNATYKAVLVGLEPGQRIPPHPAQTASYHVLDGTGVMLVDDRELELTPGITLVVPEGMRRGINATTRLALLASHGGTAPTSSHQHTKMFPLRTMMFIMGGAMAVMIILMIVIGLMFDNAAPMLQLMSRDGSNAGLWGFMIVPIVAMALMFGVMGIAYRRMAGHMGRKRRPGLAKTDRTIQHDEDDEGWNHLSVSVPAVSCAHCKQTIEKSVSDIEGVRSVLVKIDEQSCEIEYRHPATESGIRHVLGEIGYPAD